MKVTAKLPTESEDSVQQACVHWFGIQYRQYAPLLHHSVNEGKRTVTGGRRVLAMGMRKGWPDLQLCVPRGKHHGMFIEMKSATGRLSPEQRECLARLQSQGYAVAVCRCLLGFINTVNGYLSLPPDAELKPEKF